MAPQFIGFIGFVGFVEIGEGQTGNSE
jgi:hypothetical protein